jgi:mono/diheme cytochrome c family protein
VSKASLVVWSLRIGGGLAAVVLLTGAAGWGWVETTSASVLGRSLVAHTVDVPVPFPLTADEEAAVRAAAMPAPVEAVDGPTEAPVGPDEAVLASAEGGGAPVAVEVPPIDIAAIAQERAVERGAYLARARYPCTECHGQDFGGGVMVEDPLLGNLYGPNLTAGSGSVVASYTMGDWDRIVRHGIKPDGTPALMPSIDFFAMSDRELSDLVAFIRSLPPVDRPSPPSTLFLFGKGLVATGAFPLSADRLPDHQAAHPAVPPDAADTLAYGGHVAQVCAGCHRPDFSGGPILGAPPDWLPAANLTPHADGLAGWSYEDFTRAMREGVGRDGAKLGPPMDTIPRIGREVEERDMQAMFAFLQSLPPTPTGR